eukprot:tig00021168_g19088.t1
MSTAASSSAGPSTAPVPEGFHVITEGKASILFAKKNDVFYNKAQVVNRDLSIACIKVFDEMRREAIVERARQRQEAKAARASGAAPETGPKEEGGGSSEAAAPAPVEADPEGEPMAEDPPEPKEDPAEAERARREEEQREQAAAAEDAAAAAGGTAESVPGLRILEALSASGLRAIRYWKEIGNLRKVVANDRDATAVAAIRRNVVHNGLCPDTQVVPNVGDAIDVMMASRERSKQFEVVDLDPYGTASPFLDGAVQAVAEDGLLCVTCTDMAVLCGNHPETCYAKYGSVPIKAKYGHEMALRMVTSAVQSAAIRAGRYATPLACFSIDFYVRLFFRVKTSRLACGEAMTKVGTVYQCTGCDAFHVQPLGVTKMTGASGSHPKRQLAQGPPVDQKCGECGRVFHVGGPMWVGPLYEEDFVRRLLAHLEAPEAKELYAAKDRIRGLVLALSEEIHDGAPLYYSVNQIGKVLHCQVPARFKLSNALESLGYKASGSHASPTALKTTAPPSAFYNVLRWWIQKNPTKPQAEGTVAAAILAKAPVEPKPDWRYKKPFQVQPAQQKQKKVPRYVQAPEPHWGPKARAGGKRAREEGEAAEAGAGGGAEGASAGAGGEKPVQKCRKKVCRNFKVRAPPPLPLPGFCG